MTAPTSARIAPLLDPSEALRWLDRGSGGALQLHVMRVKGARSMKCTAAPDALGRAHRALDAALAAGAGRALLWQLDGTARPAEAIAVLGVVAERREQASAAMEKLLEGLSGIAEREEI